VASPKFGRTVKLSLQLGPTEAVPLVAWVGGQPVGDKLSLACEFTVRSIAGPYPQECEVVVHGLARTTREMMLKLFDAAEELALKTRDVLKFGRVVLEAGYGEDYGVLFIGDIAPDGMRVMYTRPGHSVTLRALDGRLKWKGRFNNKTSGSNTDLQTMRSVLALQSDYVTGVDADRSFAERFPSLVKKKLGFPGYESGFAIFGESRSNNKKICEDLGITPFFRDTEIVYIPSDSATLEEAVVLTAKGNGALLDAQPLGRGRFRVRSELEHRLRVGRQVVLSDDLGRPIGGSGGLFRVDASAAIGGVRTADFNHECDLTPTGLVL